MGGGNSEGIYALVNFSWNQQPAGSAIQWHTGNPDTDPWEWRMRVLDERSDIAYAKLFFRKSGYITKEWYPYFLAVRRQGASLEEEYRAGNISQAAKRIYDAVAQNGPLPLHGIKAVAGFTKEDKSQFDRGLTDLQVKMFLTVCGRRQKLSKTGEEYGWSSTVFCTTENFFGPEVFRKAAALSPAQATHAIRQQVLRLNPLAEEKKIAKFIGVFE